MDRLDGLALFVAVAECGGFVAAARKTGRSTAGVSRAVAALEDTLGQRLFNRTTRALSLTEAGEKLLERGRRLLADYDDMADALQGGDAPRGVLTLTAPVMFGRLHIMPIVRDFLRDYPGIDINLLLFDRMVSLVDEGVDLGLRIGHLPDSSLVALRVGAVRRVAGRLARLSGAGRRPGNAGWAGRPFLHLDLRNRPSRPVIGRWARRRKKPCASARA